MSPPVTVNRTVSPWALVGAGVAVMVMVVLPVPSVMLDCAAVTPTRILSGVTLICCVLTTTLPEL